jgi:superfamily II DNA/RNA helicase
VFTCSVKFIAKFLETIKTKNNLPTKIFSAFGRMNQKKRLENLDGLESSKSGFMVTTDLLARGIDIKDISYIVQYDFNPSEDWVHRSGRTARAGKTGNNLTILTSETQLRILKDSFSKTSFEKYVPENLFKDYVSLYAKSFPEELFEQPFNLSRTKLYFSIFKSDVKQLYMKEKVQFFKSFSLKDYNTRTTGQFDNISHNQNNSLYLEKLNY